MSEAGTSKQGLEVEDLAKTKGVAAAAAAASQ